MCRAIAPRGCQTDGYTEIILNSGSRYKDTGWGIYDRLDGNSRVGMAVAGKMETHQFGIKY